MAFRAITLVERRSGKRPTLRRSDSWATRERSRVGFPNRSTAALFPPACTFPSVSGIMKRFRECRFLLLCYRLLCDKPGWE